MKKPQYYYLTNFNKNKYNHIFAGDAIHKLYDSAIVFWNKNKLHVHYVCDNISRNPNTEPAHKWVKNSKHDTNKRLDFENLKIISTCYDAIEPISEEDIFVKVFNDEV